MFHLAEEYRQGWPGIMARSTGIKRPPKKGEWYLSGAVPEAYQAPNDLSTAYYIAELYRRVERCT